MPTLLQLQDIRAYWILLGDLWDNDGEQLQFIFFVGG